MEKIDTLILGAGFAGLGMGAQLSRAGRSDFLILEKAKSVGGTWRENTYPGAACDTETHIYCYSFALNLGVSRMYAGQEELLAYAHKLVKDFGLEKNLRFNAEVEAARWNEDNQRWIITLTDGNQISARVFIPAWGQLNRPQIPEFEGRDSFAGVQFHSATWSHDTELEGKRIASIGNAASAVQYIPYLAQVAGQLNVFQRSPNWILPRNQQIFTEEELAEFAADPSLFEASRREIHETREAQFSRTRTGSEEAEEIAALAIAHVVNQVEDEALREKLIPDFPVACKRVLRADEYYPTLNRENVELTTEGISRIVPEGVITTDGTLHEADVIIYGTGFHAQAFQGPIEITGRDGADLRQKWADGPEAYLGITVSGFPNMFLLYGPNTNLGHNSIISMLEIQQNYVISALETIDGMDQNAIDVAENKFRAFCDQVQDDMAASAWVGSCRSWYKNASGRVVNNWSGTVNEYREITGEFRIEDYEILPQAAVLEGV